MDEMSIKKYGDSILRRVCEPVEKVSEAERNTFSSMAETMYKHQGIGLAGPQVGLNKKLIVADAGSGLVTLANPEILEKGKIKDFLEEGCLSLPGISVNIKRPTEVLVEGLDRKGNNIQLKATGLLARVLQHEIDHLNGVLILDYASLLKRILFKSKLRKTVGSNKNIQPTRLL